jgi:hypothetical protein
MRTRSVNRFPIRPATVEMQRRKSDSVLLGEIIRELKLVEAKTALTPREREVVSRVRFARECAQLLSNRGEQLRLFGD